MNYLGEYSLGEHIAFNFQALDGLGQAMDATGTPTFEVYGDNAPMDPAVTGILTKIDGQTGFYGGTVAATIDNGFEGASAYTIRITAVIDGIETLTTESFQLAAFVEPDTDDTLPEVGAPTLTGTVNGFEQAILDTAPFFLTLFDSIEGVYQPYGGAARTIRVLPVIEEIGGTPAAHGTAPTQRVQVVNSATYGIAAAELDTGKDTLRLPLRTGGDLVSRRITRLVSQDAGMLTLEVR